MLFLSKCCHCKRKLLMNVKGKRSKSYSCSHCIPKNSGLRDDINESYDYELLSWGGK